MQLHGPAGIAQGGGGVEGVLAGARAGGGHRVCAGPGGVVLVAFAVGHGALAVGGQPEEQQHQQLLQPRQQGCQQQRRRGRAGRKPASLQALGKLCQRGTVGGPHKQVFDRREGPQPTAPAHGRGQPPQRAATHDQGAAALPRQQLRRA